MDAVTNAALRSAPLLPGQRIDAHGHAQIRWRSIISLALPMIASYSVQVVLNLTDTWFIGRISTQALAAVSAVHWLTFVGIMLFAGVGLAVQTLTAQAFGGRRYQRAARATWMGLWAALTLMPVFVIVAWNGAYLLRPFGLDPQIEALALDFWRPRLAGGALAVALWALIGFFNGIGRPHVSLCVELLVAMANVAFNHLFIFRLGFGIAGSAWATNCAMLIGVCIALSVFLAPRVHARFASRLMWRLRWPFFKKQWRVGFPMGLMIAADTVGVAIFQLMQVRVSAVDGAATQVVMMLTSIAYMPAVGIALAGTTLVGQSIGAGDRHWAYRLGNAVVALATAYMALAGLSLGLAGPWLIPQFVGANDALAAEVVALGVTVIWIGGAYQMFDGLNIACGCCLRGAGDTTVPAVLVIVLSWFVFVPLAHMATFSTGNGWFGGLPQLGFGAIGGWAALLIYIVLLGLTMLWRWRARAWQQLRI